MGMGERKCGKLPLDKTFIPSGIKTSLNRPQANQIFLKTY